MASTINEEILLDAVRDAQRLCLLIIGGGIAYEADKAKLECIGISPSVQNGKFSMRQQKIWMRDVKNAAGTGMLQQLERKGCKIGIVDGLSPLSLPSGRWNNAIWGNDGLWPDIEVETEHSGKEPFDFGHLRTDLTKILRERFPDIQHWADGDFYRVRFPDDQHPAREDVWLAMTTWCRDTPKALAQRFQIYTETRGTEQFIEARPMRPRPHEIVATMRDCFENWECDLVLIVNRGGRQRDIDIVRQFGGNAREIVIGLAGVAEIREWELDGKQVFAVPGEDGAAREAAWLDFLVRLEGAARFIPDADRIRLYESDAESGCDET
jgi:hypothetical protein